MRLPVPVRPLCLAVLLGLLPALQARAAEPGYQGTHILTYGAMTRLAEAFLDKTGIWIPVRGGGCSDGIFTVTNDRLEMGGLCCPLPPEELSRLGLRAHPVARDIKVAVVNGKNPLRSISRRDLERIHRGTLTNWSELGWIDRPVALIYRKHCLDMDEPVRRFLGLDDRLSRLADKAIVVRTDKELVDYVRRFPTAIGVTSRVFAAGQGVRLLDLDGAPPTAAAVRAGRYRFTGTLYIVTRPEISDVTRRFLDFVRSDEARRLIEENLAAFP